MLQAVMTKPGEIRFEEVPEPRPADNEVLVRVKRIGICGSDVHVYHGKHPFTSYPVIQGHEFSGEIVALGPGVSGLEVGDKVTAETQRVCGQCLPCRMGKYNVCLNLKVIGFQAPGVARELVSLPAQTIIKLPGEMSCEEGALLEPAAVGVHAVTRADIGGGEKVVVIGAGPIGLMVAMVAKASGAQSILICDINERRLKVAKQVKIDHQINPNITPLKQAIGKYFSPEGADVIIECVGSQATIEMAIDNARKGSRIVAVGVYPERPRINMANVVEWELDLVGSMMYRRPDWLRAVELIRDKKIDVRPLITHHFAFKDYLKAYQFIEENREEVVKVMIEV